ncbi:MAG TPA: class I SAM-dependent methyltransferase [Pyrinomonadaceae bacterium]|nr:class I SAM-dependent methyltransferase [Pyrinomonadaceae bacterium]
MSDTIHRFSNRVANYAKYRPGYPPEILELFKNAMGLTVDSVLADVGSGTGLSAKLFLENGSTVYGVEPNAAMREAAEDYLKEFPNFISHEGTAEDTSLPDSSIDFVIAAQAFHWFHPERTLTEFTRILRPGGHVSLIWNERQLDTTEFLRDYELLLKKHANDYDKVRHENIDHEKLARFFGPDYERATYSNEQVFDLEGLRGRVLSSSYMPAEDDPAFPALEKELTGLFAKYAENGKIKVFYDTNIYYKQY